jgi:hypothetical protein
MVGSHTIGILSDVITVALTLTGGVSPCRCVVASGSGVPGAGRIQSQQQQRHRQEHDHHDDAANRDRNVGGCTVEITQDRNANEGRGRPRGHQRAKGTQTPWVVENKDGDQEHQCIGADYRDKEKNKKR